MTPGHWPVRFRAVTRVLAAVLAAMHALVVAAPLADRADSTVAAVHMEQAGTSTHHAHGELCALCAASHLVGPPARATMSAAYATVQALASADRGNPSTPANRLQTRPRAPPV